MTLSPLGDAAVVISLGEKEAGTTARVRAIAETLMQHPPAGMTDVVPAFASVAIFFARPPADFAQLRTELEARVGEAAHSKAVVKPRSVEIPVCYGGGHGPDLGLVARHAGMSPEAVIAAHCAADYTVHAIGFSPGFPYLGGLPEALATPRRKTPRTLVPAGTVGIGGAQTGVYSVATPGGWNLIGRTPLALFDATRPVPALLRAGDRVTFRPIGADEFAGLAGPPRAETYQQNGDYAGRGRPAGADVLKAGMLTTVQDLGRTGHRAEGVPRGGAADPFALRLVNLLAGNPEDAAALEFTLVGPELKFRHDTVVALGGGDFGLPRWRPIRVRGGQTLRLTAARSGCRGYLAVAGGVDVPAVLGSRSTNVQARFGGLGGRPLRAGDVIPLLNVTRTVSEHWRIDERILPAYSSAAVVRVIAGMQAAEFSGDWTLGEFKVTAHADRMGVRLDGPFIARPVASELVSIPVTAGTVQVPPDGYPIVLLADAQTIGGYPQIAHVVSVDLPLVAQLRPGDTVRFRRIALGEARQLYCDRERALGMLREGLAQKLA